MKYENVDVNSERWLDLEPLLNEEFRDIKGYEGLYQVSNYGRVKVLKKQVKAGLKNVSLRKIKEKILLNHKTYDNYYKCNLSKNSITKHYLVHRLVAEGFIENSNNYPIINHKDSNGLNNIVSNLEWCNQSYNIKYAYDFGNAYPTRTKKVVKLTKKFEIIQIYDSLSDGARSVNKNRATNISKCCKKQIPSAYGYVWRYVDE